MGGRQDQYAAAFGGVNFMEFYANERVIVNPLRVKDWIMSELETSLVLFNSGVSRSSAAIIAEQTENITSHETSPLDAMHELKADAYKMKEALLLKGDFQTYGEFMSKSWIAKEETRIASISTQAYRGDLRGGDGRGRNLRQGVGRRRRRFPDLPGRS